MTYKTEDEIALDAWMRDFESSPDFSGNRARGIIMQCTQNQFDIITNALYEKCKYFGRQEDFPKIYEMMVRWRVKAGTFQLSK
jgi:hypothetical protein